MYFDPPLQTAMLALSSAFFFALSIQIQNLGLKHAELRPGVVVNIAATALSYWILAPFFMQSWYWLSSATLLFAAVGLFRPALSISLAVAGVKHLGPALASGFNATSPLFAAGFAVLMLGEQLTWAIAGGMVRSWPLWAIGLPMGAAFFRALGNPITMIGLDQVPSPFYAGLVSYTVSIIVVYGVFRAQGHRMPAFNRGYLWFALSGLVNGLSVYIMNSALSIGKLLTVAPIIACSPVFTLLLGLLVFKKETITWPMVGTIAMVIFGVIVVILNPGLSAP